jgi:polyisoprenoid-binding protein YceI
MSTWTLDPAHSNATFSARHMMVSTVRGQLKVTSGVIQYDPANIAASSVEAALDAASIETGVADRDNHLRSADFLDAANHPTITFKSTRVEPAGSDKAKIHGNLTVRGVTRPVVINAEYLGQLTGMDGKPHVGFAGALTINREDWGLTWNVALEAGGILVGKEVQIGLDVQGVLVTEAQTAAAQV